jgi:hypothetical protein
MIPWLILVVLAVIMLAYLKLEHEERNIRMIVTVIIIILIYLSVVSFLTSNTVDVNSPKGVISGLAVYGGWVVESAGKIFNLVKKLLVQLETLLLQTIPVRVLMMGDANLLFW